MRITLDRACESWNGQVGNMTRFDVLNDRTVGSTNNNWYAKPAAQERIQVTRRDLRIIWHNSKYMFRTGKPVHIWSAIEHPAYCSGTTNQCPSRTKDKFWISIYKSARD